MEKRSGVGGQRAGDGRQGAAEGRLERRQRELVHPERAGERVPQQAADQLRVAEQQPGLRTAEQLVAARGDQARALAQGGRRVRLVGQQRVRGEQP